MDASQLSLAVRCGKVWDGCVLLDVEFFKASGTDRKNVARLVLPPKGARRLAEAL
jgi:hypothetical protein